jgi:hypothetical protein
LAREADNNEVVDDRVVKGIHPHQLSDSPAGRLAKERGELLLALSRHQDTAQRWASVKGCPPPIPKLFSPFLLERGK